MTYADNRVDEMAVAIRNALVEQPGYESVSHLDIDCTALAQTALKALWDSRTVHSAADVPIRAVAYNHADGSIVARFDHEHGVVFGDDRPFPWQNTYLRGHLTILWHPDEEQPT